MPSTLAPDRRLFIGIMTGTSLDAIDLAICSFDNNSVKLHASHSEEWPHALREILMRLATSEMVSLDELARVNFLLAESYASAVGTALQSAGISAQDIRAIGLHGQTIRHLPAPILVAEGLPAMGATLQWGSGSGLAALSGIDVVSDFRSADVALGGQGAPLVPMFDYGFCRSDEVNRLVVNIGGISNVTWLPSGVTSNEVEAFDCGPGNMIVDAIAERYLGKAYDEDGAAARQGSVDQPLLAELLGHEYFHTPPPKSTGRELFGKEFSQRFFDRIESGKLSVNDALATATELTARSIAQAPALLGVEHSTLQIIVSGGGVRNAYLMERIGANRTDAKVMSSAEIGIDPQMKECIAFAYFAKAFIDDEMIHLPSTTGARQRVVLGSLSKGARETS